MSNTSLSIDKPQIDAILRRYGVVNVSVFGSFARDEATANSDLDLLVTYKPGTNLFDVMSLQDELEQTLGRKVDLVSQKYLSKRLAKRITKDLRPLSSVL
jgi:predicted nucleotidyltransferase